MAKTVVWRSCFAPLFFAFLLAALFFAANLAITSNCHAYTPKDPAVRRMVDRSMATLEAGSDQRSGGMAVIALAIIKAGKPEDHPQVVKAVKMIQAEIQGAGGDPAKLQMGGKDDDVYSIGISAVFLLSLDPLTYRREIDFLLESLYSRQKEHGGWGYEDKKTGDTSMTQYAVLSFWEAKQAKIKVPDRVVEGVASWLLKTQDPSGAFAYQGRVSPTFQPIPQTQHDIRISMVAAGVGSLYICSDLMGYLKKPSSEKGEISALEAVDSQDDSSDGSGDGLPVAKTSIGASILRQAQGRGDGWMTGNFVIEAQNVPFTHYYLYTLERYGSFLDLAKGKGDDKDGPKWYNAGVEYLMDTQDDDGSWHSAINKPVDTAFAVLFLVRSTQKSIQRKRGFGPGTLVGGRGLPKDGEIIRNGKVVAKPLMGPFEAMRAAMDNPSEADLAATIGRSAELKGKESELFVSKFATKLRKLVSDPSPDNRIAAIKALGRGGDIENAPILILALDDEDAGVVLEARDGLRRLSRKTSGFNLPEEFTPAQRNRAIKQWRAWYMEFHPDAEF